MATKKKPTTKKTATKTTKRPATKRTTRAKKNEEMRSFRVYKETEPFFSFRVNKQTIYWLVIAVIAIAFTAWILKFQSDINDIYNQIESMQNL